MEMDMKRTCRMCIRKNAVKDVFMCKTSHTSGRVFCHEMMTAMFSVSVNADDGLPPKICLKCFRDLSSAYKLKLLAEQSYRELLLLASKDKLDPDDDIIKSEIVKPDEAYSYNERTHNKKLRSRRKPDVNEIINSPSDIKEDDDDDSISEQIPLSEHKAMRNAETRLVSEKINCEPDYAMLWVKKEEECDASFGDSSSPLREDDSDLTSPMKITSLEAKALKKTETNDDFYCPECKLTLVDENTFTAHMTIHVGKKIYGCKICKKKYSQKAWLEKHNLRHTKTYACDICAKTFLMKCRLRRHMRAHSGEKPYLCTECAKSFSQKCHLNRHMRFHTGSTYLCEYCSKIFRQKCDLSRHMQLHKEIYPGSAKILMKPYACNVCSKRVSSKYYLDVHMRIHTGIKPFACELCDKRFTQPNGLVSHTRTHTGEKPFSCTICYKRFAQKSTIPIHMRTHTREKPYTCVFCTNGFTTLSNLQRHHKVNLVCKVKYSESVKEKNKDKAEEAERGNTQTQ